jgi:putative transposase
MVGLVTFSGRFCGLKLVPLKQHYFVQPAQNACIERFNRTFRTEVLDAHAFSSLQEVRDTRTCFAVSPAKGGVRAGVTELWPEEYNAVRLHQALCGLPPCAYAITNF